MADAAWGDLPFLRHGHPRVGLAPVDDDAEMRRRSDLLVVPLR